MTFARLSEQLAKKVPILETPTDEVKTPPPELLGNVAWLWMHSRLHRKWPVWLLNHSVLPAIRHQTYVYAYCDSVPLGFVCWTGFSPDAEKRYLIQPNSLQESDWGSGDRLWIIDMVAPFGHASMMARHLRNRFRTSNTVVRALRVTDEGSTAKVVEFYSPDAAKTTREANRRDFTRDFQATAKSLEVP